MIILAMDTSSESGSVALALGETLAGEVRLERRLQHSETLFRSIDMLLASCRTRVGEVDVFVAARGPGSFTGLRVGMAAAEGLAFTTGRQARAISTLAALAWQVGPTPSTLAPVMDARRGEIYGALFRREDARLTEVRKAQVESPAAFLDSLPGEGVVFLGPGVKHCTSRIQTHDAWTVYDADPYLAPALAEMTARGYEEPFEPLYLRPPGARRSVEN